MAGSSAEMKVRATMDNSDLKKRSKESKEALKDFAKVGEDAVSSLGEAFGVNTGKIGTMLSAVRGLGENLKNSGNAGAAAFGKLLSGVSGLTAGIAGIGIGGLIAGFKLLNEEAEAFKNTAAGASIDLMTTAYVDTYKQVLHDFNSKTGSFVAKTQSEWKKSWNSFTANLKQAFISGDLAKANLIGGGAGMVSYLANMGKTPEAQAATAAAEEAERLAQRMFDIQRQISDKTVEWARQEREIAELKRIAYDKSVDTATQQAALSRAAELINERYKEEAVLRGQLADLQEQYNGLAESSLADIDKANQLRIQEESTVARLNNALRELSERQATIAANAQKEAQARKEAADAAAKIAQSRADLKAWGEQATISNPISLPTQVEAMETPGLAIPVAPVLDEPAVIDLSNELQSILTSSFDTIGQSLGALIGDLATGEDAWTNFTSSAISAFGDMAISIGKMAISTGMATLGIKAALESLNGYVAIAAGVALVALGTAVKTGLSNIAGGNYSSGASVASASGGYGGSSSSLGTSFETRDITVNVKGSLRADGNQLLAVIENENTRRNHTT